MTWFKLALGGAAIYVLAWINPLLAWTVGLGWLIHTYRKQQT